MKSLYEGILDNIEMSDIEIRMVQILDPHQTRKEFFQHLKEFEETLCPSYGFKYTESAQVPKLGQYIIFNHIYDPSTGGLMPEMNCVDLNKKAGYGVYYDGKPSVYITYYAGSSMGGRYKVVNNESKELFDQLMAYFKKT